MLDGGFILYVASGSDEPKPYLRVLRELCHKNFVLDKKELIVMYIGCSEVYNISSKAFVF